MSGSMDHHLFKSPGHDHGRCVKTAMNRAEQVCQRSGSRLTTLRRRVLELLWQNHAPLSAYELLELLVRDGRKAQPPTIYRSLEFLLECGLIHRVESLNAYIGCDQPQKEHETGFFICESCGYVAELSDSSINLSISKNAELLGFRVHKPTIEISGLCKFCTEDDDEH